MRGYSVLFVRVLCVFVLCRAAAVVAQDETPEKKAAGEAKAIADTAREKGDEALVIQKKFVSDVYGVASSLTLGVEKLTASITTAGDIIQKTKDPEKEQILLKFDRLKTTAEVAKTAVGALKDAEAETLKDEQARTALTNRMKEVELNMTEVERAAAAVTDDISTIDALIAKAGALKTAAEKASDFGHLSTWDSYSQFFDNRGLSPSVYTTITAMGIFLNVFGGISDPEAQMVKTELLDISENLLTPSLLNLLDLQGESLKAKIAAREATGEYTALAEKARMLKETAENRRQNVLREGGK